MVRRVRAEVLLDGISQVTGTQQVQGLPVGAAPCRSADVPCPLLPHHLGRAKRESVCWRVKMEPTLSQALHLMNGDP